MSLSLSSQLFLSTLSLRRATEELRRAVWRATISIHALLAESDNRDIANSERKKDISIHALLAESDKRRTYQQDEKQAFLSTLSLRRATRLRRLSAKLGTISIHALLAESDRPMLCPLHRQQHFYPRSPCGERLGQCFAHYITNNISIHALLAESDSLIYNNRCQGKRFLSTLSLRRATLLQMLFRQSTQNFYPRSPCGERPRQNQNP